jgi:hypothetical protein
VSNHTSVLGIIAVPHRYWEAAEPLNRAALAALPEIDEYPFLSQSMFGLTPAEQSYREQVYHFAATMKGMEEEWDQWLAKFEALLAKMHWLFVDVYLSTEHFGSYHYWWVAREFEEGQAVEAWEHGGGPRSYAEFLQAKGQQGAL